MRSWIALSALALGACAAETSSPAVADHFEVVQGGAEAGALGRPLDSLVQVRLVDEHGAPMSGVAVEWSVATGGGSIEVLYPTTTEAGLSVARWTLGRLPGTQSVRVASSDAASLEIAIDPHGLTALDVAVTAHAACAIDTLHVTRCWGNLDEYDYYTDFDYGDTPVVVDSARGFIKIAGGSSHVCALTATGEAWCWGYNYGGQLGAGVAPVSSKTPQQVAGGHVFTSIAAAWRTTCALDAAGQAWCWGTPGDGSLGTGKVTEPVPAAVQQGAATFTSISLGYEHICALDSNSKAWCWGHEDVGQLGDSLGRESAFPQRVSGGQDFREITAGDHFTCGIALDRTLWCWGAPPIRPYREWQVPAPMGVGGIDRIFGDYEFMVGTKSTRPTAAGSGWFNGMPLELSTPTLTEIPGGLYGIQKVALREANFCMIRSDHQLFCVGDVPGYGPTVVPVGIPAP